MNEWPAPQSGKARLTAIINAAGDVVHIEDVVATLTVSRQKASQLLSRWAEQGWLRRVGPGAYVPVQLELRDPEQVVQDPWVLVPALFDPAYVGGRTAAAHWDLTEQVFRDVLVFTARPLRRKTVESQGAVFTLRHIKEEFIFGTRTVWRGRSRVAVSDIHRTIVDMLDDPATGGGIQHVADCFAQYMQRKDCDPRVLIGYADRLGNGAVFKRLGFLAERHPRGEVLVSSAMSRLTQGYAKLDPGLECSRLITRWRVRIPETWLSRRTDAP
jgi:predicted transcriptional regulator of viral defense system